MTPTCLCGRALLATLEAAHEHQVISLPWQWQTTLDRQMRYAKAATSGGKHDRQPTGTTLLQLPVLVRSFRPPQPIGRGWDTLCL